MDLVRIGMISCRVFFNNTCFLYISFILSTHKYTQAVFKIKLQAGIFLFLFAHFLKLYYFFYYFYFYIIHKPFDIFDTFQAVSFCRYSAFELAVPCLAQLVKRSSCFFSSSVLLVLDNTWLL